MRMMNRARFSKFIAAAAPFALLIAAASAEQLTLNVSDIPAMSAVATDTASGKSFTGTLSGDTFKFDLKPNRHYDVTLKQPGGSVIRVIDLSWYSDEAPAADAQPLGDDDRKQILQVVSDIERFTNNNQILAISGDSGRAIVLLDLRRDSDFHSGAKGEIIRRVEVWYLKNESGGWAKVQQQDRLVDRQRYGSPEELSKVMQTERWLAVPQGLAVHRGGASEIKLQATATTAPAH